MKRKVINLIYKKTYTPRATAREMKRI